MNTLDIYKNHKNCLICPSNNIKILTDYKKNYLVKCKSCGLVFCSRIPSEEELINHYSNYPIGYNADSIITRNRINELLDEFENFRINNKILDVGCGPGIFLIEAQKRGWDVYGTEFTDKQLEYLLNKGIKTLKGKLARDSFEPNMFDVIISSEVIEHIYNPIEEINNFHRLLRKGGLLYLTTPNFNAIERFILKENYRIIEYPEHLCYYTSKTLHFLLSNSGFKKYKLITSGFSIDNFKRSMLINSNEPMNIKTDELIREKLEYGFMRYFKKVINYILNLLGIGNSLKAWYIKK